MIFLNFLEKLETLPWVLGALILVFIFVSISAVGILIVRHFVDIKKLRSHHDVAGFVFANVGVFYSVLLGFTIVNVQQRFDKLNEVSLVEASYISELYRDAGVFPKEVHESIRNALKKYSESIIYDEWPKMAGNEESKPTIQAFNNIWKAYYAIEPKNKKEEIWYSESINKLNLLMNARFSRLLGSEESLGNEMWTLLIVGALLIICFMWFFGMESLTFHLLLSTVIAASVAFALFLIYSLDTAFTGTVQIPPEPYERVLISLLD